MTWFSALKQDLNLEIEVRFMEKLIGNGYMIDRLHYEEKFPLGRPWDDDSSNHRRVFREEAEIGWSKENVKSGDNPFYAPEHAPDDYVDIEYDRNTLVMIKVRGSDRVFSHLQNLLRETREELE